MTPHGFAKKLTIHLFENYRFKGKPAYRELLTLLQERNITSIAVYRGIAGYDHGSYRTRNLLELAQNLPMKIEAILPDESWGETIQSVCEIVEKGLVEVSTTEIYKRTAATSGTDGR